MAGSAGQALLGQKKKKRGLATHHTTVTTPTFNHLQLGQFSYKPDTNKCP